MTITQIDSTTPNATSTKTDALELKNEANPHSTGSAFGNVMSQVMKPKSDADTQGSPADEPMPNKTKDLTSGQEMAADGEGMPMLFNIHTPITGSWALKAVNLGPTLNVITPDKAAPDDQSLEAFARSQGLDETAVQWLMGHPPASSSSSGQGLGAATLNTMAMIGAMPVNATNSAQLNSTPSATEMAGNTSQASAGLSLTPLSPLGAIMNAEAGGDSTPSPSVSNTTTALTANTALWVMAQATESGKTPLPHAQGGTEGAENTEIQIQLVREPTPAAVWILRNAANAQAATRRMETHAPSHSELDLTADASAELVDSLMASSADSVEASAGPAPMASATHPSGIDSRRQDGASSNASTTDSSAPSDTARAPSSQRSENIQNLAEKMGQAVGQRILSEIEKGQWHLKLQLRPATLGHIEVEMRMLSGELDAVFSSPQALTRELLQEGMSKLKDTLNQMGMDVASMQVGDGQTRQGGGDSTPDQASKSADMVKNDSKSPSPQANWAPRQKMGEDGWDVLV